MQRLVKEFKEFIQRGNVLDLAVAFVLGVAFAAVINSFVNDIINPLIGAIVGKPDFTDLTLTIGDAEVRYGAFLTVLITFVTVAFALFLVVKAFNVARQKPEPEAAVTEKDVLMEIRDLLARGEHR